MSSGKAIMHDPILSDSAANKMFCAAKAQSIWMNLAEESPEITTTVGAPKSGLKSGDVLV